MLWMRLLGSIGLGRYPLPRELLWPHHLHVIHCGSTMMSGRPGLPPRVLMIVGNDVTTDSRVKREASALTEAGFDVTVLGYTAENRRDESWVGSWRLVRVPVRWTLRDDRRRRTALRRRRRLPFLRLEPLADEAAKRRQDLRDRELRADTGRALRARDVASGTALPKARFKVSAALRRGQMLEIRGLRLALRLRSNVRSRVERQIAWEWKKWDTKLSASSRFPSWRRVVPEIGDYAAAFGPVIDELAPDVIHAHDVHMVGIASDAVARARLRGHDVRWVYDAHEFVAGLSQYGGRTRRVVAAWADLEQEYIKDADRVITVSPAIASDLQEQHRLPRRPAVVLNAPVAEAAAVDAPSVRAAAGLAENLPFVVYSGGMQSARGVDTIIEALSQLPEVHFGIVAVPATVTPYVRGILDRADELGVGSRVHLLPPVPPEQVVAYLSSATVGLAPLLHYGSHDRALPNKLFEHLLGSTPVVVSDCKVMAEFVRDLGVGEVFPAGDADALGAAITKILDDPRTYDRALAAARTGALTECTWQYQEKVLREVYLDLLQDHPWFSGSAEPGWVRPAERPTVLGIGPANMAGQGRAWADAVSRVYPQLGTEVISVRRAALNFSADVSVSATTFARDPAWQREFAQHALSTWTHVLLEAGRPVLGTRYGPDFRGDERVFRRAGISVGLVFHGSEIRDPRRHAETYPFSPFQDPHNELTARLQRQRDALAPYVDAFDGTKFVSTPDLLDDVPGSIWLPVVVDTAVWRPGPPPLRREVPIVVHAPTNTALKGTIGVEAALEPLISSGRIAYRRLENISPKDMAAAIEAADIVIDHFAIGNYGVLSCEALATGRVTIGHVDERVRERVPAYVPIVAAGPDTLGKVIKEVLDDRAAAEQHAALGPQFVARFHDGSFTAQVLAPFLGVDARQVRDHATAG